MRQFYYIFFWVSKSNQIFPGVSTHFMIVYPISNYLWLPWKWKMENSTEMETTSRVEQGYIRNTTSYLELFMNTIKIKDFYNRYQYEMQKSCDGGRNNSYKIFMSWVEEGYISHTISYVELLMNALKIKSNFCNAHQYEMQKSRNGGGNNGYQVFSIRVEEGNIPNTISYVKLFMTAMKINNNFCDRYQYEIQRSQDGGRNYAYKTFMSWVEEGYIPNTTSYVELFINTLKIKNNFCYGHQYEMKKKQDGGGNNAYKIIMCRVEERNIICKHKTCLELFIATTKKKQFSELSKK